MLHVAEAFIEKNYHPTVICRAYNKALEDAIAVLDKIAMSVDVKDRATMLGLMKSCIGTKFTSQFGDLIAVANWSRHSAKVNFLLLFGDHILSLDADGNVFIWSFKGIEDNPAPIEHIKLDANFTPTCIMHPDTYLNKVLIGSQERSLQLWNISAKKKLYEFKGWNSSICSCVSSPALDVTAIGCAGGTIHVHNIRYDKEVVTFKHSARGTVTALSFSTDGQPLLASGGSSGVISIWNLEKKRLQSVIREAYESSIISLHFLLMSLC